MDTENSNAEDVDYKPPAFEFVSVTSDTENLTEGVPPDGDAKAVTRKKIKRGRTAFTRRKGTRGGKRKFQTRKADSDKPGSGDCDEISSVAFVKTESPHFDAEKNVEDTDKDDVKASISLEGTIPVSDISPQESCTKLLISAQPNVGLIEEILQDLKITLPSPELWFFRPVIDGIEVMLLSRTREIAIQRQAFFSYNGAKVEISVHRKPISEAVLNSVLGGIGVDSGSQLTEETKGTFTQYIISVLKKLRSFEICTGVYEDELKSLWGLDKLCEVDTNPYGELRYSVTFRPHSCELLVPVERRRCNVCIQTKIRLAKRLKRRSGEVSQFTPNIYLDRSQLVEKLNEKQRHLDCARAQISRLSGT